MNILISGGSGFIGSRLAESFLQKGHSVTALVHKNNIQNSSIKSVRADISDPNHSIPNDTFDVVYHLAAAPPMEKNKKTLKKVNYEGTVNFFDKVKDKTKFLVYVSGLGVFGKTGDKIVNEDTPLNPDTDYAKIRLDAQRFLESECKEKSISLTVPYLGEVYGNGGWFVSQIIKRLKDGKFKLPQGGDYHRCVVHVDDVVSALVAISEKKAQDESFIITDSVPVLFKDFINYTCDKLGIKHPGGVPSFLAKALLGGDFVKLLTTPIKTSNEKISKLIEFKYPTYRKGLDAVFSEMK